MDCPRCGKPVKGFGKTGMCRACACALSNKRRDNPWRIHGARRYQQQRIRPTAPVTLART
jgi:hypothetical protein